MPASILSLLSTDMPAPDPHSQIAPLLVVLLALGLVVVLYLLGAELVGRACCRLGFHAPPRLSGRNRWEARICRRCSTLPPRRTHGRPSA